MERFRTPLQAVTALAARQFAAISHDQAIGAGLTARQVRTLRQKGAWIPQTRGVYVVAGSPDSPERRAMVAWLATRSGDGVVSHVTAAWLDGLLPPSPLPYVTVRQGASIRCGVARVRRGGVPFQDRVWRHGLTATSVSRTIVDLAPLLERPRLEAVVDAAFCRKLATPSSVQAALERAGRRHGAGTALDVVDAWTAEIEPESVGEMRLLRRLGELGVEGVVTQYDVRAPDGELIARLDVAAPEILAGLEYDGLEFHHPRRWARDERRYARLRAAGWDIDSITKADLLPGETRLQEIVARWRAREVRLLGAWAAG